MVGKAEGQGRGETWCEQEGSDAQVRNRAAASAEQVYPRRARVRNNSRDGVASQDQGLLPEGHIAIFGKYDIREKWLSASRYPLLLAVGVAGTLVGNGLPLPIRALS